LLLPSHSVILTSAFAVPAPGFGEKVAVPTLGVRYLQGGSRYRVGSFSEQVRGQGQANIGIGPIFLFIEWRRLEEGGQARPCYWLWTGKCTWVFRAWVLKNGEAQIEMICWVGEDQSGGFNFEVEMEDTVKLTSQTEADGEVTSFGDFQRGGVEFFSERVGGASCG
jgi:hypothetical protein